MNYVVLIAFEATDDKEAWDMADDLVDQAPIPVETAGVYRADDTFKVEGEAVPA